MKHTHTNYVHKLYGNKLTKTTSTKFELQLQKHSIQSIHDDSGGS